MTGRVRDPDHGDRVFRRVHQVRPVGNDGLGVVDHEWLLLGPGLDGKGDTNQEQREASQTECSHVGPPQSSNARISASVRTLEASLAALRIRSTRSSVASNPRRSSQYTTLDFPDMGPTSITCSRPTRLAGTPEYTESMRPTSCFLCALMTAAACTPVAVRNASRPSTG